jgi:hypothetical protein
MAAGGGMEKWEEKVGASREEQRAASPLWSTCAYGVSSTGARREPGGGPVGNPKRKGRRGQGLHVAGTDFRGPRSAPYLGRCGLGKARGALTPRRRGPGRPNVSLSAGLDAWISKKLNNSAQSDE